MYELIRNDIDLHSVRRPSHIEYHCIFDTIKETGSHHFLHGVAITEWCGKLYSCFAFNERSENSITERLMYCTSDDGGITWSKAQPISQNTDYANSHSVFLPREDALWCFGAHFMGLSKERPITKKGKQSIKFADLQLEGWKFDGEAWQSVGIVCDDFWALNAPVRMADGNYMMSGCDTNWMAAAAVSHGDDLTRWDVIKPDTDGEVFTEAGAWVQSKQVMLVMRNGTLRTEKKFHAAVALSHDYGRTFSVSRLSNLPMATTKPFCGCLDDGRHFLVFNDSIDGMPHDRSRLMLGICAKGSFRIEKLYIIDEGTPSAGGRLWLSYPSARQIGDKLYIVYSCDSAPKKGANNNDAMLAIVPLCALD
jgi:hypothetical protein